MDSLTPPASPALGEITALTHLTQEVQTLHRHFNALVRAVTLVAVILALTLAFEFWRAWQRRPQARIAAQTRGNLQLIASVADEYRTAAARSPELAAIGRKYGLEPMASPASAPAPGPAPGPAPHR